jgi:hypothetical protein
MEVVNGNPPRRGDGFGSKNTLLVKEAPDQGIDQFLRSIPEDDDFPKQWMSWFAPGVDLKWVDRSTANSKWRKVRQQDNKQSRRGARQRYNKQTTN